MEQSIGAFGTTTRSMISTEFFRWFHLEKVAEDGERGEATYRPDGDAFRSLVWLVVEAGPRNDLRRMDLSVARRFIDDTAQAAFARDIIKSFCLAAAPSPQMAALADELMFRDIRQPVLVRKPGPVLGERPSEAFETIVGLRESSTAGRGSVSLHFANSEAPDPCLTIRATPVVNMGGDKPTPIWGRLLEWWNRRVRSGS